jgi:membrane-bound serine protease (ClpP class)
MRNRHAVIILIALIVLLVFLFFSSSLATGAQRTASTPHVLWLDIAGPVGPALSDFIERSIRQAEEERAQAVIVQLDTPGGLDTSMRSIIKAMLSSRVPVVVYVGPSGARAASAGTYIVYASHVAAMSPATNIGAATPVSLGPGMLPGRKKEEAAGEEEAGSKEGVDEGSAVPSSEQAMRQKVVNDAVAYIIGLAQLRGRNAQWAEAAVRSGVSVDAGKALELGVIDLVSADATELLVKLHGREVMVDGESITLDTSAWSIVGVKPDWKTRILAVITDPNVAYLLLLAGVYGLLFELYSPGAIVPGVVGIVCLILALYALHLLPISYAGVALLIFGIVLMVAELVTPSFGLIGAGGVGAFIVGSMMLFDTQVEGMQVSLPLLVTLSVASGGLFIATVVVATRLRNRSVVTGREEMIGSTGQALTSFSTTGRIHAHGEIWQAHSSGPVSAGQQVRITDLHGLTLEVEPVSEEN